LCERNVDIFEKGLRGDASHPVRGLDNVVTGAAGLFATKSVGKDQGFGELTRAHQETGTVNDPLTFNIHNAFFHHSVRCRSLLLAVRFLTGCGRRPVDNYFQVERLYAQKEDGSIP